MAAHLIKLYNLDRSQNKRYFHIGEFCPKHPGDFAKLVYWGLVEEQVNEDTDKRTSGSWAITKKGKEFVCNEITVMSHVNLYDSRVMGFDGTQVNIQTILGKKFNYEELMAGK